MGVAGAPAGLCWGGGLESGGGRQGSERGPKQKSSRRVSLRPPAHPPPTPQGLRTLVLGTKIIEDASYLEWDRRYQEAAASFVGRDDKLDALGREIEEGLELIGVTAIEDKLQVGPGGCRAACWPGGWLHCMGWCRLDCVACAAAAANCRLWPAV